MRFASAGKNRASNYTAAGASSVRSSNDIQTALANRRQDVTGIAIASMDAVNSQNIVAKEARAAVLRNAIEATTSTKIADVKADADIAVAESRAETFKDEADYDAKEIKSKSKAKMAGSIAAMGALAAKVAIKPKKVEMPEYASIDYSGKIADAKSKLEETKLATAALRAKHASADSAREVAKNSESSSSGGSTSSVRSSSPGLAGQALDVLGKYESDGVGGYNAINQIGIKGGHGTLGYSGDVRSMSQHGGRALTDFTVGEIMDLQADDRTRSNQQWIDQGRFHAVGRYQFIGPTFAAAVQRQGISRDTKFTPDVQDQMALAHLRGAGSIQPWVGPSSHATDAERSIINQYLAN